MMQIGQVTYIKNYWKEIESAAEELFKQDMPELRMEDFDLFYTTGNRLIYEAAYFGRRKYLTVYGILAVYRGEQLDIDRLVQTMETVCAERFWALPAHVNGTTRDELTIDLFAAETAQTLAELVYLLQEKLSQPLQEKVLGEVMRRVMLPYMQKRVIYGWETDRCNWSAVCAGSIGMAAIYLYRMGKLTQAEKDGCVERVCASMQCYLDGMEDDGACTEGLGYYSYGMSYFTGFAQLLSEETHGAVDLMKNSKCENIATFQQKCYFGGGVSVSFSDGSSKECFLPGLTAYMKHCYPAVEIPDYTLARPLHDDHCYRWLTNERNIRWLLMYGENCDEQDVSQCLVALLKEDIVDDTLMAAECGMSYAYNFLPSAQWMICKDANGNGYAAKGGHNAESHNHNDIGHFLVTYKGEMLLTDLGAGEYTKDYFGQGRYGILCNRSLGHSVPLINGKEQCEGKEHRAQVFEWSDEEKSLTISFADAYSANSIEQLTREIRMPERKTDDEKFIMQITDTFSPGELTSSIVENIVTQYEPIVDNNDILINGKQGTCRIMIDKAENIAIIPQKHSNHEGIEETVYLVQWSVPLEQMMTVKSTMIISCE